MHGQSAQTERLASSTGGLGYSHGLWSKHQEKNVCVQKHVHVMFKAWKHYKSQLLCTAGGKLMASTQPCPLTS
jgi:hypothetical protein